jgi:glutamate N-acetyltransferase/amino-acid N-acetyltransferase
MNSKIKVTKLGQSKGLYDCPGYLFSATASDIRDNQSGQLDLALIVGEANQALKAGAVFTQNDVTAAPVDLCKTVLGKSSENIGGIVVNSGNANACTGEAGISDAREMSTSAQVSTGIGHPFFVCSTGRIGRKMPINKIIEGIATCSKQLGGSQGNSEAVSKAILTSDTFEKSATVNIDYKGQVITLSGIAKGAGMIEPNMATMLAFLVTDLDVSHTCLQNGLKKACDKTLNCISIDGDMSTNDSVILLANGHAKLDPESDPDLLEAFEEAIFKVCDDLARKIVSDGEKNN